MRTHRAGTKAEVLAALPGAGPAGRAGERGGGAGTGVGSGEVPTGGPLRAVTGRGPGEFGAARVDTGRGGRATRAVSALRRAVEACARITGGAVTCAH